MRKDAEKALERCGYNVIELWECEWQELKKMDPDLRSFLRSRFRRDIDFKTRMSQNQVLSAVREGTLFGMVECDIEVPEHLKDYFVEMTPIFKNVEVSREDVGEHMANYAKENGLFSQPRRTLIGSYKAEKILLATPLLKWYLEHNLKVSKVYQVVQYWPEDCFRLFGEEVSQARRDGDRDSNLEVIANTMKLLGNCGYGKTVTNKDRHREVVYCTPQEAPEMVNEARFRKLQQIDKEVYEVEMAKKEIRYDLPLQIGFFVYSYAKLRMLQFYYDFLDKFIDRQDFEYVEMDTDSAYVALAGKSLEELVKPHLRGQFYEEWDQWFQAEACDRHRQDFVTQKTAGQPWTPQPCCQARKKYDRRPQACSRSNGKAQA